MKKRIYGWILSLIIVITTCFANCGSLITVYGETEEKGTVTVYFTLSEDGKFVTGNDDNETVLCHIPVTISYFDLAEYGMEDYYRYEADSFEEGGRYNSDKIVERPTLLHLFIKMLEKYYLGKGEKFVVNDRLQDAMSISGSATSLYMTRFWGHDENLMYYVNHEYPLQAAGWGSTSDYILLEDGMEIDVAMFSDWDFYHTGAFSFFTSESTKCTNPGIFDIHTNENITLTMRGTATNAANDGNSSFVGEAMPGEKVVYCNALQAVSDYNNDNWKELSQETDDNGQITLTFDKPGTYYVSSTSTYENYKLSSGNACVAPPIAVINVSGENVSEETTENHPGEYDGRLIKNIEISNGISDNSKSYKFDAPFDANTKEYTITVPDYEDSVCVKVGLEESVPDGTEIKANYTDTNGESKEIIISGNDELGKKLGKIIEKGTVDNKFVLTAAYSKVVEKYTFNIKRQTTLKGITFANEKTGRNISIQPEFNRDTYEYEISIPKNLEKIETQIVPYDENYNIYVNDEPVDGNSKIDISTEIDGIKISAKKDECSYSTYIIKIAKTNLANTDFKLTNGSIIQIKNSDGEIIAGKNVVDTQFTAENLLEGEKYTYVVTKYGYKSVSGSFVAGANTNIDATLKEADVNNAINKGITSIWSNFRGNDENNGVTKALTPTDYTNSMLYWAEKVGTGFGSGAPSSPILVGDDLVYTTATSIVKVDTITGKVIKSGNMIRTSAFNITPPTYADGMIFVALASGAIQAFNAETLESLWVYEDPLYGQPNSPITYHNGYIYTGFWNGETGNANYVCLSVTDEDVNDKTEKKTASWTYTSKGGFYWAGSYVCDKYLVVGTDDGAKADEEGKGSLIVLDSLTGNLISRYDDVRGDIRCSASFDKETERFYFTSKGGDFCSAKIDSDGTIEEVKKLDMGSSSTSTPVICNKRAYVGVKGKEQFGVNSGHHIAVVNLDDMSVAYNLSTRGYPQTSGLATTGYESEDGYTYVYFIDNYEPGKIRVLKDKPGQTKAIITRDSEYEDENDYNVLFSPKGAQANYAICSLISDDYGTMYFKNDSAYMMALGSKITKIQVTKQPDKLEYKAGEKFDPSGMEVTAFYSNGKTRNVTKYVTVDDRALTSVMSDVEVSFNYVLYNDELSTYGKFDPLIDTVNITVTDKEGEEKAADVVNKINGIGDVITLDSKQAIIDARNAYDQLDSSLEKFVTNYQKLIDAENVFRRIAKEYLDSNSLGFTGNNKGFQKINLSWNNLRYADGYLLYKLDNKTGEYKEIANFKETGYEDTQAIVGSTYQYKIIPFIRISNKADGVILGNESIVQTKSELEKAKGLKVKKQGKKYLKIKWNRNKNFSGYVVYRKEGKSKKFKIIKTITSNKKTTYIDRKVKRNKKYYYKIRGFRTVDKKKIYGKYSAVKSIKR